MFVFVCVCLCVCVCVCVCVYVCVCVCVCVCGGRKFLGDLLPTELPILCGAEGLDTEGVGFPTQNSSFQPSPIFDGVVLALGGLQLEVDGKDLALELNTSLNLAPFFFPPLFSLPFLSISPPLLSLLFPLPSPHSSPPLSLIIHPLHFQEVTED